MITALHRKIAERLYEIRSKSGVWISRTDIAYAFKPLKMGLRVSNLHEPWNEFVETYDRVNSTCSQLLRVELSKEERDADLEAFQKVRSVIKRNQMMHDTSFLLNQEI